MVDDWIYGLTAARLYKHAERGFVGNTKQLQGDSGAQGGTGGPQGPSGVAEF